MYQMHSYLRFINSEQVLNFVVVYCHKHLMQNVMFLQAMASVVYCH